MDASTWFSGCHGGRPGRWGTTAAIRAVSALVLAAWLAMPAMAGAEGRILRVGPDRPLATPSAAAAVADDGDIVEIDAGTYRGDAAIWRQNGLVLRGVGGMAHLAADGAHAEGKAIWVIKGNDTTIENIEFSGARVPDRNGAGIRLEGAGLTVRGSFFHDNEMGILTGPNAESDVLIEHSEFARNRVPGYERHGSLGHNIYIGRVRSFTLRFSYVHHAETGHNVKSRAERNFILYNRIADEGDGASSYLLDLPNGGESTVMGNVFHQGRRTENIALLSNGAEGASNPAQALRVVNNTFVSDHSFAVFIDNGADQPALVLNNLFIGRGLVLTGPGRLEGNVTGAPEDLVDHAGGDFRPGRSSAAIDAGMAAAGALTPGAQYEHPLGGSPRPAHGSIDAGAYEFSPVD